MGKKVKHMDSNEIEFDSKIDQLICSIQSFRFNSNDSVKLFTLVQIYKFINDRINRRGIYFTLN